MTDEALTFDVAVRAGLDEVWRLIATGEGRAAWFGTEASIELVEGGASRVSWDGQQPIEAVVDTVEPGRRLRLVYAAEGEELGAEEYLLSHADGVTHVRLIQSLPPGAEEWEGFYGDLERGWRLFLASLVFAAEDAVTAHRIAQCRFVPAPAGRAATWSALCERLGLADPSTGDVVDVPLLPAATVRLVDAPHTLLLAAPDRTAVVDLEGSADGLVCYAQAATHGTDDLSWRERMLQQLAPSGGEAMSRSN